MVREAFMRITTRWTLFLLLTFTLSGCSLFTNGGAKVRYPNKVNQAWREEFNRAEGDFEAKKYSEAEKGYRSYVKAYPYNELTDKSEFRLGQISMLRQDWDQAVDTYQALVRR